MTAAAAEMSRHTRVRASRKAIETVLDALAAKGLSVEKLCVIGGQVDIIVGHIEGHEDEDDAGGLKRI